MPSEKQPYEAIFHPSDFSEASETAFCHALKLALAARCSLTLLHATDQTHADWHDFPGVRTTLERWKLIGPGSPRRAIFELGVDVRKVMSPHANPVDAALHYLDRHYTDLVVLATHSHEGRTSWLHHSIAEPIARGSHAPTLFIPHGKHGFVSREDGAVTLRNILIPVAAGASPAGAIRFAARIVEALDLPAGAFHILHVGEPEGMPSFEMPKVGDWTCERITRRGPIVDTIVNTAKSVNPDLVVMRTEGHLDFLDVLRGNTTERVLHHSPCPLLAIPVAE